MADDAAITPSTELTASALPRPYTTKTGIKFQATSGAGTPYTYRRFTLDPSDYGVKCKIEFAQVSDNSDFTIAIYSNTASDYSGTSTRLALSTDDAAVTTLPALTGTFQTTFDAPSSGAPYLEFRIYSDPATSTSIVLSDIVIGPGQVVQGAAVTDWQAYTPVGNWVSNVTYTGRWRRVGTDMEVDVTAATSGAVSGSFSINLPTGYTIDTSNLTHAVNTLSAIFGSAVIDDSSTTSYNAQVLYYTTTGVRLGYLDGSTAIENNVNESSPITFGAGDFVHLHFSVPIAEWAGSGTLSVLNQDNLTGWIDYTPTGTWTGGTADYAGKYRRVGDTLEARVRVVCLGAPTAADLQIGIPSGLTINSDAVTAESGELEPVLGSASILDNSTSRRYPAIVVYGGSSSTVSVNHADTGNSGIVDNSNPFAFTTSDIINVFFSVPIVEWAGSQSSLVGFSEVQPGSSSGLVSANGLKGRTDGTSIASGYVGQEKKQTRVRSSNVSLTSSTAVNVTSSPLVLDAGIWELSGAIGFAASSGSAVTGLDAGISTTSATTPGIDTIGVADSNGEFRNNFNGAVNSGAADVNLTLAPYRVSISSETTYYLVAQSTFGSGTVGAYGTIRAVRIA